MEAQAAGRRWDFDIPLSCLPFRDEEHTGGKFVLDGGLVAFNLYSANVVSWNVVMDLKGELRQVAPARSAEPFGPPPSAGGESGAET